MKKVVNSIISDATVRLERDPLTGEWFGMRAASPTGAGERALWPNGCATSTRRFSIARPGRPRLSDSFLREIAAEWDNERSRQGAASYALATRHGVQPSTVQQWMFKARARGLAKKESDV